MNKVFFGLIVLMVANFSVAVAAQQSESIWDRENLTNGFFGLNDQLADSGIEIGFSITNIYQHNVKGGISTNNSRGRFNGSYDLELCADLDKLLGLKRSSLYILVEGGFPNDAGIDEVSVGSTWGINADAIGNDFAIVKEFYYHTWLFGDAIEFMVGKIDFTGYFDASEYANCEVSQFMNAGFVDNPTIPFPEYSLGFITTWHMTNDWYLMGGIADAQADGRETGFHTAFDEQAYFFYILESGLTLHFDSDNGDLPGTYRVGCWYDPQPKGNTWYEDRGKYFTDDAGMYVCCDQMLCKENADPDDSQGLGGFFRYGFANQKTNDLPHYFSFGFQYQGPFEARDDDVLGFAFGHGSFSDTAYGVYSADHETNCECYYCMPFNKWFVFTPSVQYITNPGGNSSVPDAAVIGARAVITF